jgi:very-short-patch-repair endonuclease
VIPETKCLYCEKTFTNSSSLGRHQKSCYGNPNRIPMKGHANSPETKRKISEKLKKYYAGRSIWSTQLEKRKSYAEQYFDSIFTDAEQNYHVDRYFLDLAWPEKRIYIEIDGEQHYNDPLIVEHDKIRTERLLSVGWTLISRIRWSTFQQLSFDEKQLFVEQIKQRVDGAILVQEPLELEIRSKKKRKRKEKETRPNKFEKLRQERWELLQNSGIDFSKFGWAMKVGTLFGISPNRVSSYIRKNFPDFYAEKCFQRKK